MAQRLLSLVISLFSALSMAQLVHGKRELVLALEDTFEDFNLSLWKHELTLGGGGNWEFQYYTNNRSNSYVEDGVLHIRPTLLADDLPNGDADIRSGYTLNIWGGSPADLCTGNAFYGCNRMSGAGDNYLNPVKSARIRTAESFSFTYGKVEVRAKLPRGDWLWPAIWMLPTDNQYGNWPASGEIDIMESRGNNESYAPGGYDIYGSTLHWGLDFPTNQFPRTHATLGDELQQDLTADFHTYGFIWNETYMGSYLDSESNIVLQVPIEQSFFNFGGFESPPRDNPWRGRGNNAPFDRRFYLLINLAVGGTTGYFPDGFGKPWVNEQGHPVNDFYDDRDNWYPTWTQSFQIDSIRVWTFQETGASTPQATTMPSSAISALVHILSENFGPTFVCIILSLAFFLRFLQ